jgi:glycosyltransferase involved in cell wall biosynthesis
MPLHVCQLCAVDFTLRHFLTALMDGMHDQGWAVTGVCSDGSFVPRLREQGYRVQTLPVARGLNPFRHAVTLVRLMLLFRRERFDIVHVHTPIAALLGRIAGRLCGVPMVVYTAHGFYFHERMHPLPKAVFLLLERLGGSLTDLLFTQSTEDAATAVDKRFLSPDRVVAIGNGVDPAGFKPGDVEVRTRIRASLGIPDKVVVVGMIGRMVSEKGYGEFFAAAARIAKARPDVFFVAIGDRLPSDHAGSIDQALDAARATLGPRLVLTGLRSDIPDLLAALDIFTLPSYREGMPRTIIEAMMTALPVVATDIRGSREEVVDGETGLLVPVRNDTALAAALQTLVDDPEARTRMGRAGRTRALALFDESRVVARQIAEIRARLPTGLRERA